MIIIILFFFSKIKVLITIENNEQIEEEIRSNYDIYNILEKNNIPIKEVFIKYYPLEEVINNIYNFTEDKIIKLTVIRQEIPKVNYGQNVFDEKKDYKREEYSKFFSEYFQNFNQKNNNKIIKFTKNKLRTEIFNNILLLRDIKTIKKYKITGPFATGKSMTLFFFSRFYKNVIYINLKVLKSNNNDSKKCLVIILS